MFFVEIVSPNNEDNREDLHELSTKLGFLLE
jgi:hypothetical protein